RFSKKWRRFMTRFETRATRPTKPSLERGPRRSVMTSEVLEKPDRDPRDRRNDNCPDGQRQYVAPDRAHALGRVDTADGASDVIPDAKGRCEQTNPHRQDDHHRIVHLMDADGSG